MNNAKSKNRKYRPITWILKYRPITWSPKSNKSLWFYDSVNTMKRDPLAHNFRALTKKFCQLLDALKTFAPSRKSNIDQLQVKIPKKRHTIVRQENQMHWKQQRHTVTRSAASTMVTSLASFGNTVEQRMYPYDCPELLCIGSISIGTTSEELTGFWKKSDTLNISNINLSILFLSL